MPARALANKHAHRYWNVDGNRYVRYFKGHRARVKTRVESREREREREREKGVVREKRGSRTELW